MPDTGLKAFVSYSHKDESLRSALDAHLSGLVHESVIEFWSDRAIEAGEQWEREIEEHLEEADIVLLLISSDFLASPYCYAKEMNRALERHERGVVRVVPVILRPVDWHHSPFGKLQALPKDGKPITTWLNQDEALADVAAGIRLLAASILGSRGVSDEQVISTPENAPDRKVGLGINAVRMKEETITVTVRLFSRGESYQCDIPLDLSVEAIITELAEALSAPRIELDGRLVHWHLFSKRLYRDLDSGNTLRQNGVVSGDELHFHREVTAG